MSRSNQPSAYQAAQSDNPYQPLMAKIDRIVRMVEDNHLFTLT